MKPHQFLKIGCVFLLFMSSARAQTLGTTNLLEGPNGGSDSVVLAASNGWTATANSAWLHLSAANQGGMGNANVVFSFDPNSGATRTGTLTVAGQTLNVSQAGSTYSAVTNVMTLVSSGLFLNGVAVDSVGSVYITDSGNNKVEEWVAASNTVFTLVSSGFYVPEGVAVDGVGNVYFADWGNNAIKEWVAASNTVRTLVSSGLNGPYGVAVDGAGNVYFSDFGNNAVDEWMAASNIVITLVSSGLNQPYGVAVDSVGNVYIADSYNNAVKEWVAASNTVITLVSSGLGGPTGLAVDGKGNVYIADYGYNAIKEWVAASNALITLVSSGLSAPNGVAVGGAGNVYISDHRNNAIKELPHAYVDTAIRTEPAATGSDSLSVVLPGTANLTGPFAPFSDSAWLTISSVTNGIVSFAFTTNPSVKTRKGNITVAGMSIPVIQLGQPYFSLGTTNLLEGPTASSDSVMLAANNGWTATANNDWLHLTGAYQSGMCSTNVIFTFDANAGATRTGTLTIAGLMLTVTQAGSNYVLANPLTTLVSSGLHSPYGVAVDGAGNVYIADTSNQIIKKWSARENTVTTLVSSGLNKPAGLAMDSAGNVYIADSGNNAIKEWTATNNSVITLLSSGLNGPADVAVDSAGNVYIADYGHNAIKEWIPTSNSITTLVSSGLFEPAGVSVDNAGNVYIANTGFFTITELTAADNKVTALVSSGLKTPYGTTVDGAGNVYIADSGNGAIKKWTAANQTVTTLASLGAISFPRGMAVDGAGNVYFADESYNTISELPHAFVDPTAKLEGPAAGCDVLPVVLPSTVNLTGPFLPSTVDITEPFLPRSDSDWLTITGSTNGVVKFAFTANSLATNRVSYINLLGQLIPVTQAAAPALTDLKMLSNGAVQFSLNYIFTNVTFTVFSSSNLSLPLTNWTVLATLTNNGCGQCQFTDLSATNGGERFYRVSSP